MIKLDDGSRCDRADKRVYRQSRAAGLGCLVSVAAAEGDRVQGARDYYWVHGFPAAAHEIHPQDWMRAMAQESLERT